MESGASAVDILVWLRWVDGGWMDGFVVEVGSGAGPAAVCCLVSCFEGIMYIGGCSVGARDEMRRDEKRRGRRGGYRRC